ncbi:Phosphotyrosyl phosphatase activator [Amylocystis lapponica]|nr:Phosphotyrosyl phosphatase activator [Amylocystis lapponica]
MSASLPPLRHIPVSDLHLDDVPTTKIRQDEDVEFWKTTRAYQDYGLFLRRLNESVVGCSLPWTKPITEPCQTIISLIDTLDRWVDEIPPLPTPQRFGNLAFRTWGKRLESEADTLLSTFLPHVLHPAIPFLAPYLVTSFGSPIRMDYGTGHETSFALLLLCLTLLRFLLCWRLQDVYNLEPAGSHGVWGLDDSHFLGYVFGSGQLRGRDPRLRDSPPPLPATNLYFMSIMRIHQVKHGPFHEHSSQLYSIATGVASWTKVNSGLFKMYEAEVLGKRVVVQHIPLGGLLDWSVTQHTPTQNRATTNSAAPLTAPRRAGDKIPAACAHRSSGTAFPTNNIPRLAALDRAGGHRSTANNSLLHVRQGLVQPARMPLGPTASTTLRPSGRRMAPPADVLSPVTPAEGRPSEREDTADEVSGAT